MSQDKYTKVTLTVIAFSLFWIALNLSVLEFVLYDFYTGEMKKLFSEMSNESQVISLRINEFYSRITEISSRMDEVIDAIKRRQLLMVGNSFDYKGASFFLVNLCLRRNLHEKDNSFLDIGCFWYGMFWR